MSLFYNWITRGMIYALALVLCTSNTLYANINSQPNDALNQEEPGIILNGDRELDSLMQIYNPKIPVVYPPGWDEPVNTGTITGIYVTREANPSINGIPLKQNDYIGGFFVNDQGEYQCGGAIYWPDTSGIVFPLFGDDPQTPVKDGFAYGETIHYKLFSYDLMADFDVDEIELSPEYIMSNKWYPLSLIGITKMNCFEDLIVHATADQELFCDQGTALLDAEIITGSGDITYNWTSVPPGFTSSLKNPSAEVTENTVFKVQASMGDATASSIIPVCITQSPVLDAGADIETCGIDRILLAPVAQNVSEVQWTTSGDGTFEDNNTANTFYFFGANDLDNNGATLSITAQPLAPCTSVATDHMEITLFPSPQVTIPQGFFTCQQVAVDIEATATNVSGVLWQTDGNGTFSNPNSLVTTYTPGTYSTMYPSVRLTLTGYGQSPCDATFVGETFLQINKPAYCNAGGDATICANQTYTTCGTASYQNTSKWYTNGDGTFADDTQLITTYTPGPNDKITGKPRLTLYVTSIAPCTGSKYSRMDLWITPEPLADAGADFVTTNTDIVPLDATASSYSSLQWSTSGDGTFADAQQAVTNYYPGPDDTATGSVLLSLQANPLSPCATPAQDDVLVSFVEGATANAGADATICGATTVSLQGSAFNHVSVLWSTSGDGTFSDPNQLTTQYTPGAADVASGLVTLSLTPFGEPPFANGNPDQKILTILQPAVLNTITALASVCQTQPINLSATAAHYASLLWTSSGDGVFNNTTIVNPQYTPGPQDIANGNVVITLTASSVAPCSGNAVMNKSIQIKHAPIANAGNDLTVCQGVQVPVNGIAQHNSSILWTTSGDGVFVNPQQLTTNYIPGTGDVQQGTATLTLTAGAQQPCTVSAADQLVVTIFKNPVCNAGIDIASCERQPIAISGTAANYNSLVWETNGSGTFTNKYVQNTTYHPSDQDVTNGGVTLTLKALPKTPCQLTAQDSKLITLSVSPLVAAGSNITICEEQNVQLTGTATHAQSVIWSSDGDGVFANASALSTTYTPGSTDITNGQAVLHLTAVSGNACSNASASLTVSITKNPVVNAGNNGQVALGSSFKTNTASAIHTSSTLWTTPNGAGIIQNANAVKATYIPTEADYSTQVVILKLTAAPINPCVTSVSDEINLIVTSGCEDATAFAGADMEVCYNPNTPIALAAATAQNYASLLWTTQGDGTFSNTGELHPTYTPGNGDGQNGYVILNLLARGTGVCNDANDQIKIVLIQPATVYAGADATICVNQTFNTNPAATNAETLQWTTSGDGVFANPNQLMTTYTPGAADVAAGQVQLCLSAQGMQSCPAVSDCMTLHFQPLPTIFAGPDLSVIIGDVYNTQAQAGNYSSLLWSTSGDGTFANPSVLSTTYTPGQADIEIQHVTLTLTAYPENPCMGSGQDNVVITLVNSCQNATVDVGPDRTICESANVDLGGSVLNQTSVLWNTSGDGTFDAATNINTTYFPGTADLANGNVELCLTAFANGECSDATDCLTITFGTPPTVNAGADISICKTNSFVALSGQAQNYQSIQWVTLGTGYFVPPTSRTPKYFFSGLDKQLGEVQLIFKATNAVCGTTADTLTVTLHNPPVANAGADATICASQHFINNDATATDFSALLWTTNGDGTFDDASMLHATYYAGTNDATTGTVMLTLSAAGHSGCQQAQSSHTLTLIPSAYANAGDDRTICETETVALAGEAANYENLLWETTGDGTFGNAASLNTTYFPGAGDLAFGYLEISLTAYASGNCGDAVSERQIYIVPMPTVDAGNNQQICAGDQVQLSATANNYAGLIWSTSGDGIFDKPSALNAIYTPGAADLSAGGVTLCLTVAGAEPCGEVMDCTEIDIIALPTVNAGADATLCQNETLLLTGNAANYSSLLWTTTGDGTFTNAQGINAQYHPGNLDLSAGSVVICLNAQGLSGCGNANDCMMLTLQKNPVAFAGNDATIDQGSSYQTLQANAENYSWLEWTTSGSGTFANPLQAVTTYTPSQADCHNQPVTLTLTTLPKNPCTTPVSDALLLSINILNLMADAGEDAVICSNQNLQLAAQAINYTSLQWSTSGNGTFDDATALNPIYTPCLSDAFEGSVILCLEAFGNDAGESITDCLTLTFQQLPIAFAGSDNTVPIDQGCHLQQSYAENYETIQWYTSNGMGMFSNENILHPVYYASPMDVLQNEIFLYMAISPKNPCEIAGEDVVAVKFVEAYANAMAFAGTDMHLCKGLETNSVPLTEALAKNFTTILWTTSGNGTFNYDYISRPEYYPSEQDLANGSVTLTLSVAAFGTYAPATDQIVLYFEDMPEVWAGDDMTVCSTVGLPLYGTASNYASLTWTTSGDGIFTDGDTPQAIYYPGSEDALAPSVTLCLEAEGYGECLPTSDCITVTFVPVPEVNAGNNAAVCAGNSYVLQGTAENYASVQWTSEGDGTFDNAALLQATYTPGTADLLYGSVELCLTAQGLMGCPESISCTTLEIRYNPLADAGSDAVAITGQEFLIDDATAQYHSAVQWITNGSGIFGNAGQLSTTYTPSIQDEQQQQVILTLHAAPFNPCTVAAIDQKLVTITPGCLDAIVDAGADLTVCYSGAIALNATAQNQTGVEWNTSGDGTFDAAANSNTNYFPGTADRANGNVELCLTAFANGECNDDTDCLTITFGTPPTVNAGADISICKTNSFVALSGQAQNYQSIQWVTLGTGYFVPPTSRTPKYFFSGLDKQLGEVQLIFKATNAVCGTTADTLTVTLHNPPVANAGADATICASQHFINNDATATDFSALLWTTNGDGTFDDASMLHATYYAGTNDATTGTVMLTLSAAGHSGCQQAQSSHTLTLIPSAYANAGDDRTICETETVALAGEAANYENLLWETTGDGTFGNAASLNTTYFPGAGDLAFGYLEISLTAYASGNCGDAVSELQINILPMPTVDAGNNQQICAGNQVQLSATANNYAGLIWSTSGDGIFDNPSALNTKYTPGTNDLLDGNVELCLTAQGLMGCPESIGCLSVDIQKNPIADAGQDAIAITGQQYLIDDATAQYHSAVQWITNGSGIFGTANQLNTTYTPSIQDEQQQFVTLTLQATPFNPCIVAAIDQKLLTITPDCQDAIVDAGADLTVCYSGAIALNATAQNQIGVEWNTSGDGTFDAAANINTNYFPGTADRANGNVQLCLTAFAGGNCNDATDCLEITFGDAPVIDAGEDATLCVTENYIQLFGSALNGGNILWLTTGQGSFTPPGQLVTKYFFSFYEKIDGYVDLILTATNSPCETVYDTLRITFNAEPIVYAGEDATICGNEEYVLFEAFAADYQSLQWVTSGDGTFEDAAALNTIYYPGGGDIIAETIELQLIANPLEGCASDASSFLLTLIPSAYSNAGNDLIICETGTASLAGQAADYESLLWTTNGDGIFGNAAVLNTTYLPGIEDIALGQVVISLTAFSSGNCGDATDEMLLTLQPLPVINAGTDFTICESSTAQLNATGTNYSSIVWTTAGDGTFDDATLPQALYFPGVDDITNGFADLTITAQGISSCAPGTDNLHITLQPVPQIATLEDAVICPDQSLTVEAVAAHYQSVFWGTSGDGTFAAPHALTSEYFPGAGDIAAGGAQLCLTATGLFACDDAQACMQLTIISLPEVTAGTDVTICNTGIVELLAQANNYETLQWISDGDGTFSATAALVSTYVPGANDIAAGGVKLCLNAFAANGCGQTQDCLIVTLEVPPAVDAGVDQTVCLNQNATVSGSATNATSVLWSTNGDGTFGNSSNPTTLYYPGVADYANLGVELCLTANSGGNCGPVSDCVEIAFQPAPTAFAGDDKTVCANQNVLLQATATGHSFVFWNTSGTGSFSNPQVLNPTYIPSVQDKNNGFVQLTIRVNGANGCGFVTDALAVTFVPVPLANAGADATTCQTTPYLLNGSSQNAIAVLWTTTGDGTFDDPTTTVTGYTPGVNDAVAGYVNLCLQAIGQSPCVAANDCMKLTIMKSPIVNPGADVVICAGNQATLQGQAANHMSVQWSTNGDGTFANAGVLLAKYFPGTADISNGGAELCLTAFGKANCDAVSECLTLSIVPVPVAYAGVDATIEQGQSYQLQDASADNYSEIIWHTSGMGVFADMNDLNTIYTPTNYDVAQGSVVLMLEALPENPCEVSVADEMTLSIDATACIDVEADAGADLTICTGQSIEIENAVIYFAESVLWSTSGDGTFDDATLQRPVYFPGTTDNAVGMVTLSVDAFATPPCQDATDCLKLTILQNAVAYAGGNNIIPEGIPYEITDAWVENASNIQWYTTNGMGFFQNPTSVYATYIPSPFDYYQDTIHLIMAVASINPCTLPDSDEMALSFTATGQDAQVDAGANITICGNDSIVALSGSANGYKLLQWTTSGDGLFSHPNAAVGNYTLGAADQEADEITLYLQAIAFEEYAWAIDSLTITKLAAPLAEAGQDKTVCEGGVIETSMAYAENYASLLWTTNGDGTFMDASALVTMYSPGAADAANGQAELTLTAFALAPCTNSVSSSFKLSIDPLPNFLINLTNTYVIIGESLTLLVEAEDATGYQWYGPDGMIAGAELPELFIAQAAAEDEGYYYCEAFNDCGTATSNVIYLQVYEQHAIAIPKGWSGLSSWIVPANPGIEAVFAPYQDNFVIARNYSGMYYPLVNVNTLNFWDTQTGYTVNFNGAVTFMLTGDVNVNRTVEMSAGWNYLPVISSCPVNVDTLFAGLETKIQIIKEIAGSGTYWPAVGVNTIGNLQPGRAYELRAIQPFSITFAECNGLKSSDGAAHLQPKYDTPWNDIHYSSASHSIAIQDDLAATLRPGDILGAFTASGICAGAHQMSDFGNAIVLFGDDELTAGTDGFSENENIRFEVVRPATGEQFALEVSYDAAYACHNGRFVSGGVSAISKTSATAITTPDDARAVSVYPNPTSGTVFISGVKSDMQIELRNASGQLLQTIPCRFKGDDNRVAVDVSSFASGVIYMRIYNEYEVIHRKLIVN
ncbi:MAG: T9SS type A sorting domain-containing protein [Bacteroidales bacterium]|nr:T9SS type A sorting domain-containing protein [Bacteroidales bacterium]